MRRKFLSVVLCVCMMLTMAPFAFATEGEDSGTPASVVAKIGDREYSTLQEAIEAATNTQTITLLSDIDLARTISVSNKTITLNLDGHKLYNTADLWDLPAKNDHNWSLISVRGTGNLTITGNGTLQAKKNDCYAVDVQDGSTLTIENGTLVGNIHAVYVHEGTAYIKGGTYSVQQKYSQTDKGDEFVLNCYDANRSNGSATISVSGGSFINFNPANCQAEGANTNFCAEGYSTKQEDEKYTVMGPVAAIDEHNYATLSAAVNAVEAADNKTVTLLKDVTEDLVIPADKTVTLDLNGKKLTNVSSNTITNNGTLTITGTGTVDNVTHQKAALYNKGTATVEGGTYTRSAEASTNATNSGNNSYYVIDNYGTLTINKGTFKFSDTNAGAFSSLIHNGWYDGSTNTSGQNAVMTINDGNFTQGTGGKITVKNDDYGELEIKGGVFTQPQSNYYCVYNYNIAKISGGTINGYVGNEYANATCDKGLLEISNKAVINGGIQSRTEASRPSSNDQNLIKITDNAKVAGAITSADAKYVTVSGGYFTTDPTAYLATGKGLVDSDLAGYYKVGNSTVDVDTEVKAGEPSVNVPANSSLTKADVENAAKSQATQASLAKAASSLTSDSSVVGTKEEAKAKLKSIAGADATITVVVQPYLDVKVTEVNNNAATMSVNISALYNVIATTNPDNIILTGTDVNAVNLKTAQHMSVSKPVTIKLPLPSNFGTAGDKLSIKHAKGNGSVEYYTGTVTKEGTDPNTKTYVTFTTNGFSPFTIYAASQSAASVNGVIYPSFQEAVNAAQNNDEITLLKGDAVSATMTGSSKTIKVKRADTVSGNVNVTVNGESKTLDNGTAEVTFTYTRPSSGGSISAPTTYAVNVNAATNGAVAADKKTASKGTTVTVTASPSKGYMVDAVKVVDKDGKDVAVTVKDGKYVFTMPASAVTVTGSFKAETPAPVALPFTDVKSGNWFYDAVKYAYAQGLMTGTSATTFAPNGTMNRAMIVTVLYRLEKSPAVTGASKFTDVPAGQWYSDAVAWAAANKIVNGYDETTFGPMNAVTREQMAAILFRYEQVKGLENVTLEENLNRFPDQNKISAYAIPALQWAVGQKIINGNADGTLDPTGTATRAQVAQIFTNLLNK